MSSFRAGAVSGFEIRIDSSWFVLFFLMLWSFSAAVFPARFPGLSGIAYFTMGATATILLFVSLLAHELAHSVVARAKGIPVEGITLFIFGGMARTSMEAEDPRDELLIAGVGPLTSMALGVLFLGVAWLAGMMGWGTAVGTVASYLGFINFLLAAFNLLPGFPLDGGRLFRALVWRSTGDLTKATRWASTGGRWLGYGLMGLGFLQMFAGAVLGGLWLVFIGWFLRGAAEMTFREHLLRTALEGVPAREIMTPDPESVGPELTVQDLVDEHFLRRRYQAFPVVGDRGLAGLVTLEQVKEVPRDARGRTRVADVMSPANDEVTVDPAEPVTAVLEKMRASGAGRVLVIRDGQLAGIISGRDIVGWAQRAQDLGDLG